VSLEIHHREKEGIEILDLKGRLSIGDDDLVLRDALKSLCQSKKYNVILNLREVSEIDSLGVGTLVFAQTRLASQGGRLALLNLQVSHLQLFILLRLEMVFDVYDDELDSVNSFFPDRVVTRVDVLTMLDRLGAKPGSSESQSRS
jgi:anti-anti-sigma factor